MPTRIKVIDGHMYPADDPFTSVADDEDLPQGDVILSLARFQAEGDRLLSEGRAVGVRLKSDEEVEALAYDLPRLSVVALEFPKFRDGRIRAPSSRRPSRASATSWPWFRPSGRNRRCCCTSRRR